MIKAETTEGKTDGLNCTKLKNIFVKQQQKIILNYVGGENTYNINNSKYLLS